MTLDDQRKAGILYAVIEDRWPINHASLKTDSDAPDHFERVLQRLLVGVNPSCAVRRVEPALGRVYYRIPSARSNEELTAAIDRVQPARPDPAAAPAAGGLSPVLRGRRTSGASNDDRRGARVEQKRRRLSMNGEPAGVPRLLFGAGGQVIETASVPELLREVVRRFGKSQALQQQTLFTSGRVRYFVAREARHAAGHAFVAPLPFKEYGLVFEANQSRFSALKSLRLWFEAAAIPSLAPRSMAPRSTISPRRRRSCRRCPLLGR